MQKQNTTEKKCAIEFVDITKKFGSVIANHKVSMKINYGEILSLLGENGSGKTTLMNMLSGIYYPDEGHIIVDGEEVSIKSPKDAYELGIGMVHQHFKLVDVFTALDNIILGTEGKMRLNRRSLKKQISSIIKKYGFDIDLDKKIYEMSVSEKQGVEIVKMLYRGAKVLILDEPTAVLTPQETEKLFNVMRNMKADGKVVIIITHKLNEVLAISDRVAVLRKGEYIGSVKTASADEMSLTEMMVGKKVTLNIDRSEPKQLMERIRIEHLTVLDDNNIKALDDVNFQIYGGEILGIAGIAGSGQKELLESIAGLQQTAEGSSIKYIDSKGEEYQLIGMSVNQIKDLGISLAFVPEDRLGMGLVGNMGMTGNMMLRSYREGRSLFTDTKGPRELATDIKDKFEVVTPNIYTPVRKLSGGNVQKVLVGREISQEPKVLMTAYAVRGLDINTSYTIYNILGEEKEKGVAVIYCGEDLDVLLQLCDRILVMCDGKISGIVDARTTTKEDVGMLMARFGGKKGVAADEQ